MWILILVWLGLLAMFVAAIVFGTSDGHCDQ